MRGVKMHEKRSQIILLCIRLSAPFTLTTLEIKAAAGAHRSLRVFLPLWRTHIS